MGIFENTEHCISEQILHGFSIKMAALSSEFFFCIISWTDHAEALKSLLT